MENNSLNSKAWKRLKRNKSAMFGMGVIILATFLSLAAYIVAPDNSPSGNEQLIQLETQAPGFSIYILKKNKPAASAPLPISLADGFVKDYDPIPITSFLFEKDSLQFSEYRGSKYAPEGKKLSYADILGSDYDTLSPTDKKNLVNQCQIIHRKFWLGTDKFGRDILSRLIIGARVSLSVGLISVFISLLIGVFLGALAGYFTGWPDQVIMWTINVFWSIPTLLLAMGLYISAGGLVENKLVLIFIAVGLTMWVDTARMVRGQFIAVRDLEFVTAARSMAFSDMRIIFRHILPNILGPVIVIACANFASAILVESGLSYIGLGIQPPAPSWGSMLNEYKDFIDTNKAYLSIFPGLAIMLLVLAFNLMGNGLRDALDVKGQVE